MNYGAIDLHLRHSQIRVVEADGSVVLDRRITTSREGFTQLFGDRLPMRILLETGTESEWVAQCLEACGHDVVVADPNYLLMYGARQRQIKTDKRDVAALAEACRLGIYRKAHRVSGAQRQRRRELRVREQLVRVRTQAINLLRAQLRQEGYRLPSGSAETIGKRYARLVVPAGLHQALTPLLDLLTHLGPVLKTAGEAARVHATADPVVQRLMTVPGIGPITALTYRATVDDIGRFKTAGSASAFFGLVPHEDSSGERQRRGRITKAGPPVARSLLIQAAWVVWRNKAGGGALHAWVLRLADRRGKRVAVVALARRLSRILYALWRDGTDYRLSPLQAPAEA
ncbi:MAG TPA: IS110 family transposase [Beijerinckiaceae bacterium]|nr:IS110 family transposase [Beijerinckiaceae bacterium]